MAATTEELLQTILQSLEKVEYIKAEDIPNIDLYMDQVLTFMDRKLRSAVRPQTEDRVLTKTMINNYAKNDLLPPPVKKKYSKEHVLMLIFIYYYKGVIPMNEIQTLLQPITEHYFQNGQAFDLESVYKEVVSLEKEQLEDLKKERMILRLPSSATRKLFEAHLLSLGMSIDAFDVAMEVDNIATIKDLIRKDLGVSILARSACMDELRKGKLTALPIENLSMVRQMNLVYRKDFPHMELLYEILRLYHDTAMQLQ